MANHGRARVCGGYPAEVDVMTVVDFLDKHFTALAVLAALGVVLTLNVVERRLAKGRQS